MRFKIGDKVKINEKESRFNWQKSLPIIKTVYPKWYSTEIFTVVGLENDNVVILDRNLPENSGNKININFLISVKKERKKKLLKLNNL